MRYNVKTYWRYKGRKGWEIGYPQREEHGLIRMAFWVSGELGGPIVSPAEIEYKQ